MVDIYKSYNHDPDIASRKRAIETSDEATLDAISPQDPSSLKNRLKELEKACGGKKK